MTYSRRIYILLCCFHAVQFCFCAGNREKGNDEILLFFCLAFFYTLFKTVIPGYLKEDIHGCGSIFGVC